MEIVKEAEFKAWKDKNTDTYGSAIFRFAEQWADEMEKKLAEGKKVFQIAEECERIVDRRPEFGITGYMYGAAVSILTHHWKYGDALARWHNKKYLPEDQADVAADEGRTVNPAILSVEVKE